jgi:hypothetical protein
MPERILYRSAYPYNPLATTEGEQAEVQADTQGYHEIKVYNETRDRLRERLLGIKLISSIEEMPPFIDQLKSEMARAHTIWLGINESILAKKGKDKPGAKQIETPYKDEFIAYKDSIQRYLNFITNKNSFIDEYGNYDKEYEGFKMLPKVQQAAFIKERLEKLIDDADGLWAKLAARINLGLPLKVSTPRTPFL